jgi:rfaE bifunctional protein kinase chain/domain
MHYIHEYVKKFSGKRILVVGDIMLDRYIRGDVHRISPEAPVPVVLQHKEESVLGGAGNVAENIAALGGKATLVGVVGKDEDGKLIEKMCKADRITSALVADPARTTAVKMRIVARGHQLLRVDREHTGEISKQIEASLIAMINKLPAQDFVIVSDYDKGTVTAKVMQALKKKFGRKSIIADIKPDKEDLYRGIYAITPNTKEAREMTGVNAETSEGAENVLRILGVDFGSSVILTRGEHGMSVYNATSKKVMHVPSHARHVYDVTGAGDTVIAVSALMLAAGAPFEMAASVANAAGGIVVGKEGTSTLEAHELMDYLENDRTR